VEATSSVLKVCLSFKWGRLNPTAHCVCTRCGCRFAFAAIREPCVRNLGLTTFGNIRRCQEQQASWLQLASCDDVCARVEALKDADLKVRSSNSNLGHAIEERELLAKSQLRL
jgi:hypothetical protein